MSVWLFLAEAKSVMQRLCIPTQMLRSAVIALGLTSRGKTKAEKNVISALARRHGNTGHTASLQIVNN